uniref:Uncharacterized protein n=1 Tax=Romanomermis culicivorax TaxID=13658 RepID=A0A915JQR5_ROMCU
MPTATGYFTQKTVTTTTTTTKTVPKQKENVQYFTSQEKKYNNSGPPVPEPRNYKAMTNRDMNKILTDVKSGQNKNVVLDTLAALVTDCNATAEVLRSRSSSKTNVNEEQRDVSQFFEKHSLWRSKKKDVSKEHGLVIFYSYEN